MKQKIIAKDKEHLTHIIKQTVFNDGYECELNHIDVSNIDDMSELFSHSPFNGNISKWDTSKVTNMYAMFVNSNFNGDIVNWNTSNVKCMDFMFKDSQFNQDLSKWNVSKVKSMDGIFSNSKFTRDITDWKPIKLKELLWPFIDCSAPVPYWAEYDNLNERRIAINNYLEKKKLTSQLSKELSINETTIKKVKI